jgi:hypothetical protein
MAITDNLLAYWKLDNNGSGGISLVDATGNGNTLSNSDSSQITLSTSGKINGCASFSSAVRTLSASTTFSLNAFTVSAWVKFSASGSWYRSFAQEWDGSTGTCFFMGAKFGNLWCAVSPGDVDSGVFIGDNNWHLACMSYDPITGTMVQYVDGKAVNSTSFGARDLDSSTRNFTMGSNGSAGFDGLNGLMDEVAVWSRVLSPLEIYNICYMGEANGYPFTKPTIYPPMLDLSNSGIIYIF